MRPLFLFAIYGVAFASVTIIRATADANNPAHDLAQKFAFGDQETTATALPTVQQPQVSQPQIKQPPATRDVTAPKPAVAAPKQQAQVQTQTQTQTEAQAQPQAPAARPVSAPKAAPKLAQAKPPRTPAPGADYERDMLEAARAEAAEAQAREKLQTQQAESKPPVVAPTPTAATAQPPATAAPPPSPPASAQATTPQVAPAPAPTATPQIRIEAKVNVPAPAIVARPDGAPRATILAVLTQHAGSGGRSITPPDPIICVADICYISAGPNADAKLISRSDALSTKNTVTSGAGACKGMSRCAYRGVSMQRGDEVQIIDLGLVGHDKREPADVTPDTSCRVEDGDLICDQPVAAPDYRIWVVPENVAAAAGPGAIEHALADDLPEEDMARDEDK